MRSLRKIFLVFAGIAVIIAGWLIYKTVNEPAVYVTSYGAAGRVSGSLHMLKTKGSIGFIDCGNFYPEGEGSYEERLEKARKLSSKLPVKASKVDYVILTHAHLDHIGRLPLLVKEGFQGKIYVTPGTAKLMYHMLRSAVRYSPLSRKWVYSKNSLKKSRKGRKILTAHWNHCEYQNKIRRKKTFRGTLDALEEKLDVHISPCKECAAMERDRIMNLVDVVPPGEVFKPTPNTTATFVPNGHIPGSASVFMSVSHEGKGKTLLFSGDVGKKEDILQKTPLPLPKADFVWFESTYGDHVRDHSVGKYTFRAHVRTELEKGRVVWIPAFALDRTQKVLYALAGINMWMEVDVPSPLANAINEIYRKEHQTKQYGWFRPEVYEERLFPYYGSSKPDEFIDPKVVITTSGMMDTGYSESLLGYLLPREDVSIFLVGYQDPGTPGGQLEAGKQIVKWKGKTYMVNASVFSYHFFSAHADMNDALYLLKRQDKKHSRIHLIHGEPEALQKRKRKLLEKGFRYVKIAQKRKKLLFLTKKLCP